MDRSKGCLDVCVCVEKQREAQAPHAVHNVISVYRAGFNGVDTDSEQIVARSPSLTRSERGS